MARVPRIISWSVIEKGHRIGTFFLGLDGNPMFRVVADRAVVGGRVQWVVSIFDMEGNAIESRSLCDDAVVRAANKMAARVSAQAHYPDAAIENPRNHFDQFYHDMDLNLTCKQVPTRPGESDWARGSTHWKCTLRQWGNSMTFYYSMGPAHSGDPKVDDVLNSLASDARIFDGVRDSKDLASDLGIEAAAARKLWAELQKISLGLKRVLGRHYDTLLELESL